jgi:DNA phosphorothioation-associated putative methyltransferase
MKALEPKGQLDQAALHAEAVRRVEGGKRVGDAVYLHSTLLAEQAAEVQQLIGLAANIAGVSDTSFNVARIALRRPEVALLSYPNFFEDAFPAIRSSCLVDLAERRASGTDFSAQNNPPILHRKELLLPEEHPQREEFRRLTAALEDYSAFDHPQHLIGRKLYWRQALEGLGLRVDGHVLIVPEDRVRARPEGVPSSIPIARHRTAISRSRLSTPMQALAQWGFLDGTPTVLDYGCGRGDDIRALAAAGLPTRGWDPHFLPETSLEPAEVVNLGFVLNVIEDARERAEALRRAYSLAQRVLSVAVMLSGKGSGAEHGDGVLTTRGTFQRYFTQSELREYVGATLGREPVNVGPGVVFVFRSDEEEQAFLARRQRSTIVPSDRFYVPPAPPRERAAKPSAYERHQDLLDDFWATALELGRLPEAAEFRRGGELASKLGSPRRAFAALPFAECDEELRRAAARRTDDLLVYLAMNVFERRGSFQSLPAGVQRDIRGFFGSYKGAMDRARAALFEAGDRERTAASTAAATAQGLGVLDPEDGDYTFHVSTLGEQPAALRVILGCAERLEPIASELDLLKIHGSGDKVSYLWFDGFATRALPVLARRMVVDLRRQRIAEVSVDTSDGRRVLLGRARFMPAGAAGRERQERFDEDLRRREILRQEGLGPGLRTFAKNLIAAGIDLKGGRRSPLDRKVVEAEANG